MLEMPFPTGAAEAARHPGARWLRPHHSIDLTWRATSAITESGWRFRFRANTSGCRLISVQVCSRSWLFSEYEYGVFHPRGGCGAVMEAMAGRPRSRRPHSDQYDGRAVISRRARPPARADARRAVRLRRAGDQRRFRRSDKLPDGLRRRWTDAKLARKRFSCSTFMLYPGIAGRVDLDHHTIFLAEDYARISRRSKKVEYCRDHPRFTYRMPVSPMRGRRRRMQHALRAGTRTAS